MEKFKDMSTVKPLKVTGGGRESKLNSGGYKETKDGYARASAEGRRQAFLNDVPKPITFKGKFMSKYPKKG